MEEKRQVTPSYYFYAHSTHHWANWVIQSYKTNVNKQNYFYDCAENIIFTDYTQFVQNIPCTVCKMAVNSSQYRCPRRNLPRCRSISWMVQWYQCEPSTPRPRIADSPIPQHRTLHARCPYHGWFVDCSTHIICMRQQSSGKRAVQGPDAVMSARSRRIAPWGIPD